MLEIWAETSFVCLFLPGLPLKAVPRSRCPPDFLPQVEPGLLAQSKNHFRSPELKPPTPTGFSFLPPPLSKVHRITVFRFEFHNSSTLTLSKLATSLSQTSPSWLQYSYHLLICGYCAKKNWVRRAPCVKKLLRSGICSSCNLLYRRLAAIQRAARSGIDKAT